MTQNDWIVRATAKLQQLDSLHREAMELKQDELSLEGDAEVIMDDAQHFLRMICNRVSKYEYRLKKANELSISNAERIHGGA